MSYPKWIYHAIEPARIVADEAEHAAAGPGWAESPGEALALLEAAPVDAPEPADPALSAVPRKRGRPRKVANAE
jgi:hypothetical protein